MMNPNIYRQNSYLKKSKEFSFKKIILFAISMIITQPLAKIASDSNQTIQIKNKFDTILFTTIMQEVKNQTKIRLHKLYPQHHRDVQIVQIKRDEEMQKKLLKMGKSQTWLSLHQVWAACDFRITVDWVIVTATWKNYSIHESIDPYRVLWWVARKHWLFWWLPRDVWHVWSTRYIHEFLEKYPECADNQIIISFYQQQIQNPIIDIKYKKFIEMMDLKSHRNISREFEWKLDIDELINPL